MLKSPVFWVMYVMFVLTATGGLIATAQLKPVAKDMGLEKAEAVLLGISVMALPFTLSVSRVLNGVSRPFFGWVSDHIGRENTMFIAFVLEAFAFVLMAYAGASPVAFVLVACLVFFAYGEIYSLFPAACADSYGKKFASANSGLLYTAKGTASLIVPISSVIAANWGGWTGVFYTLAGMNLVAAILAFIVLKPMRAKLHSRTR
jgi:OFA family oxalate/formate antiporter-like MFS transporter